MKPNDDQPLPPPDPYAHPIGGLIGIAKTDPDKEPPKPRIQFMPNTYGPDKTIVRAQDGQVFAFRPQEVAGFHYEIWEGNRDPLLNAPTRTANLSVVMGDGHVYLIKSPLAELVLAVLDPKRD